ncbi:histidine phosphatase family protein [Arthrobacter halodurans]|uniref:Histidine phosphatase family protein n=1 Tax=Arthrobacter halodurans TaxID=516699 RepID=A0ABV4ULG4_9MICC
MASRLALVRHGETDWNAEGRLQGQTDIPLNAVGRGQARAAGHELSGPAGSGAGGPARWDVLVSSPLARAAQTASHIGGVLGLAARRPVADLMERHYGDGEGRVVVGLPRHDLDRLLLTAEPERDVAERGVRALAGLVREHPESNIVVVAHGTLLRLTLEAILGERHPRLLNGQVVELDAALLLSRTG